MYLSRLTLNGRHNRARSEFERPYEMHRTLSKAWDDVKEARVLFRPEKVAGGRIEVIVQSLTEPDWSRLDGPAVYLVDVEGPKHLELGGLQEGQRLQFRLRCRPTKRIGARDHADRGKRRGLTARAEIFEWLRRKGDANGFKVCGAGFDRIYWQDSKNGVKKEPIGAVVFDGVLAVTDPERIREAVCVGIGTQKAFGFGLLSVARLGGG